MLNEIEESNLSYIEFKVMVMVTRVLKELRTTGILVGTTVA